MFSMEKSDAYRKGLASGKKWDGGGGPGGSGRGPYGGGPRGPPRGLDNVRGIDHSSLPACGSCCGWGDDASILLLMEALSVYDAYIWNDKSSVYVYVYFIMTPGLC